MTAVSTRDVRIASGGLSLAGVLHLPQTTPAPGVVVCHPHPQYGGDMHNNVVLVACETLAGRGCAALRFDFRGAGASEGSFDNGRGERDDVSAAIVHLSSAPEVDAKRVGLMGYSFGAMMAAEAASGDLRALALVSPPVAHADLRVAWGCPAFIVGGDRDAIAPADRLGVVADAPGVELLIVEGADHFWAGYEHPMADAVADFFERHFQ